MNVYENDYACCSRHCYAEPSLHCYQPRRSSRHQKQRTVTKSSLALALVAAALPATVAQTCISLQGSTSCPAFTNASISTDLTSAFPFLAFVSDLTTFDNRLREFINTDYARTQYRQRIGCSKVNLSNTTNIYARYTTSVVCSSIVQASIESCKTSSDNSRPLCADSCAQYAISEQEIASSPELCGTPGTNAVDIIRSDFTTCSNPTRALFGSCIDAAANEAAECGYQSNLQGLCSFCGSSSPNATDSCCVNANVESRCANVHLPTTTSMPPLFPSSTTSAAATGTSAGAASGSNTSGSGLSGGAIAGIVVGSLVGAALILAVVIFCCIQMRKRKDNQHSSILNTPSPGRQSVPGPPMTYGGDGHSTSMVLPGARVARMSALEGTNSERHSSRADGGLAAYHDPRDDAYDSPDSARSHLGAVLPKRGGSLSSQSVLAITDRHSSPRSGTNTDRSFSSPEGVASGQSEQLQFFKDYYSQDDIHPNDTVATLWAYQPRANDEFELERGDMLKVVGIWDDGWATGVKLSESTEQWEARKAVQRDSGVSNGSRHSKPEGGGSDIKAFPLVCVCLPQHWRKTIEGDSTDTGAGSGGDGQPPSP